MPRIKTVELLVILDTGDFKAIRLKGLQNGSFYMMIESAKGSFIHESADGRIKEYPKADNALAWLKRKASVKEVVVDIEIWQADSEKRLGRELGE